MRQRRARWTTRLQTAPVCGRQVSTRRVSRLAAKQGGRITTAQLRRCGLSKSRVVRWERNGRLHRVRDGLYAVGHMGETEVTPFHEALLLAGPGAALSHITAAWWRGLLRFASRTIHVSAPGARRSRPGLFIHHPGTVEREWHRDLPVTPVAQTLLDASSLVSFAGLRRALAITDRERPHDSLSDLRSCRNPGAKGLACFARRLRVHMPELARTQKPARGPILVLLRAARHRTSDPELRGRGLRGRCGLATPEARSGTGRPRGARQTGRGGRGPPSRSENPGRRIRGHPLRLRADRSPS